MRQGHARALRHRRRAADAAAPGEGRALEAEGLSGCTGNAASRRAFLAALAGGITAACAGPTTDGTVRREDDLARQAVAALADAPMVDVHAHPDRFIRARGDLSVRALAEMRDAGVRCAFFAAVGDGPVIRLGAAGIRQYRDPDLGELRTATVAQLERVRARARGGATRLVTTAADLASLGTAAPTAALLAIEGGDPLEGRAERVREMYDLGVRSIQIVHYRVNELGDIQTEPPRHRRLTDDGAAVVAEMNRLRMVVDGAHAASDTLRGILDVSRAPIVVSHTGPAALRTSARHLGDAELRAVAAKGGVIGVWPFVSGRSASLDQFLADLRHVSRVAGIDHTAIGTDMTGLPYTAIASYRDFGAVPAALLAAGFSESDTRKLVGGNAVRVVREVLG